MKALAYERAHELKDFAIRLMDVPEPALRDADLLVEVRAIGINPGEAFIRRMRSAEAGGRVILGWEFAGVVVRTGLAVEGFETGDRVFGTGDVSRDGCWAERVAVDHRIVATLPDSFPFDDAASLPVGAITAWEAIFRDRDSLADGVDRILIVGGAGGVGSLATQLLKATTKAFVICTASRPESQAWCRDMGADLVVDHTQDIAQQLEASSGQKHVDMVLSTAGSAENIGRIAQILRPFGQVSIIDAILAFDASLLAPRSITLHTEMIFSRILAGYGLKSQAHILETTAALAEAGPLRPITTTRIRGLSIESMRIAHEHVETRRTVGKVVITV
jgi:zinc-binding alcohol dehydrogenase family protein